MTSRLPIGQLLINAGRIDAWQLQSALSYQRRWGGRLGEAIVALGFMSESTLLFEVSRQLNVPYFEVGERHVHPAIVRLIPERLIRSRRIFPLALASASKTGPLIVATAEPQNLVILDEVSFATGMRVKPILTSSRDIERLIARHLGGLDAALPASAPTAAELPPEPMGPMRVVPFERKVA